jgi:hypothetical protein
MQFLLSHLSHCLSVHHLPPSSHQYKSCSFSCPICPTVFQFTTHHNSVTSTNHAAAHSTICSIPLLLSPSAHQISPSAPVLVQYFRVNPVAHKHTPLNSVNSVFTETVFSQLLSVL